MINPFRFLAWWFGGVLLSPLVIAVLFLEAAIHRRGSSGNGRQAPRPGAASPASGGPLG